MYNREVRSPKNLERNDGMKKFICTILAVMTMICLVGCGSSDSGTTASKEPNMDTYRKIAEEAFPEADISSYDNGDKGYTMYVEYGTDLDRNAIKEGFSKIVDGYIDAGYSDNSARIESDSGFMYNGTLSDINRHITITCPFDKNQNHIGIFETAVDG